MALNGSTLGIAIKTAVLAVNPDAGLLLSAETALVETYWQAAAGALVTHFQTVGTGLPGTFNVSGNAVTGIGTIN